MADIFDPAKRSEVMSRIRSTGTEPETRLYEMVRGILGHRWRIDRSVSGLPGQPDVVVPTLSLAVFADGCFFSPVSPAQPDPGHQPGVLPRFKESSQQYRVEGFS